MKVREKTYPLGKRSRIENIREQRAEENIWTWDAKYNGGMETSMQGELRNSPHNTTEVISRRTGRGQRTAWGRQELHTGFYSENVWGESH